MLKKQNLLDFSGLIVCVGKKNSTNLNDLRISMTKKTSNTYLPGLYTKNCLSYRYGPHPKRCRRLDVRIGSEDLQTRSEHFPPMSS